MRRSGKAPISIVSIWTVKQAEEDTVIGIMKDAELLDDFVVIADAAYQRLLILDSKDGNVVRTYGRKGRGPAEFFEIVSLTDAGANTVLVQDRGNARFTRFDLEAGKDSAVHLPQILSVAASGTCRFHSGSTLVSTPASKHALSMVAPNSEVVWQLEKVWREHNDTGLERGQYLAGDGTVCIAVSTFGPGIVVYASEGEVQRALLREHFGRPTESRRRDYTLITGGTASAAAACVMTNHFAVLRDHLPGDSQLIDFYERISLKYIGSVESQDQILEIRCRGDKMLLRKYVDGLFQLELIAVAPRR